jgi:DNA-binding NtrC family response regulator
MSHASRGGGFGEADPTGNWSGGDDVVVGGAPLFSLLIYHREGVEVVRLEEERPVVVGRADPADVKIPTQTLSRRHAQFTLRDGVVTVEDLESTNGTDLNGERITEKNRLEPQDEVTMGGVRIRLHVLQRRQPTNVDLCSHDQFATILSDEVTRAESFNRTLALIVVLQPRSREDREWYAKARDLLRPVDRMGQYGPNMVEICLPEMIEERAMQVAKAIAAIKPEGLLVGVALYPEAASSAEELLEAARSAARQADARQPVRMATHIGSRRVEISRGMSDAGDLAPIVRSPVMRQVYDTVERLAKAAIPVLITGETGTGKEVLARAIHEQGSRRSKPMRCINCGAIPADLIESVLFGHEKGAFTGASERAEGVFEAADGGTVLLDEIGELSHAAQAALLRVLETKKVTRVGSNKEIEVDVRILAATHRNLEKMCEAGGFRLDLLYRLNAMTLRTPPLRERPEEIVPLAESFVAQANRANDSHVRGIDPDALGMLCRYSWPGNVREVKNVIDRAVVIAQSDTITTEDLPERVRAVSKNDEPSPRRMSAIHAPPPGAIPREDLTGEIEATLDAPVSTIVPDAALDFKGRVQRSEAALILDSLLATRWNKAETARRLQIPLRTLMSKISAYGLEPREVAPEERAQIARTLSEFSQRITTVPRIEGMDDDFRARVGRFEACLIKQALEESEWNKAETARKLRIPPRTLTEKIKAYQLER